MDYIGGIDGMNFAPVTNYNNYLKGNKSFDIDSSSEFENILNQYKTMQNNQQLQGSITTNNFDDIMAQANIQAIQGNDNKTIAGNFINDISNSVSSGLNSVNNAINSANQAQEALAAGEDVSVHDVMIAAEKASLNFSMAMQLRNKLLSAYTEINNVKV